MATQNRKGKHMKTYKSGGHLDVVAESMKEAAQIFADRKARKAYGKGGYARTCNLGSWSPDNSFGEFSAFIGRSTGRSETMGGNVNFTVYAS
jgi:hypothetical protein